jgi:hypothetical protein
LFKVKEIEQLRGGVHLGTSHKKLRRLTQTLGKKAISGSETDQSRLGGTPALNLNKIILFSKASLLIDTKIPNSKHQIPNKYQIPIFNDPESTQKNIEYRTLNVECRSVESLGSVHLEK